MKDFYMNNTTEELVALYQRTHRDDYLQEIIRRNNGLLNMWARSYSNIPSYDTEDLFVEATVACWKAVEDYDPDRAFTFSSCLKGYVTQRLNRLYAEATRKKRYTGYTPVSYEELEELNYEGSSVDDYSDLEVFEFIDMLSGTVKKVANMLLSGMTKGEIAKALHITPASTTYHLKRLQQAYTAYRRAV